MNKFKLAIGDNGKRYIYAPDGTPVLHYWWCLFGRIGNHKEFNMYVVDENGEYIISKPIACTYGGMARTIVHFLNTGQWKNDYDESELIEGGKEHLLQIRHKYINSEPAAATGILSA